MLQKYEKLVDRSGSLSSMIDPNFVCRPHWRKVGCLTEDDLGIFATTLKGEICRGKYLSIERVR